VFKILSPNSNLELSPTNFMNLADLPFIKRLIAHPRKQISAVVN
jgi:hypothetical protein